MQGQHKDVVKNITSATQLESELQISQAQHGVAVLDVYNAEWGNTKALSETFRLLHTNAGDTVHLRFFSVECNAVMESLQDPEDKKRATAKPKGLQASPDTLSTFWSTYVGNRVRHSKPYFMFYKEGQFRAQIEGIDTPRITRVVNDLCKQQNPVTEYITNTDLLRFWQRHFSSEESEVPLTRFMHAIRDERTEANLGDLTSADIAALSTAVDARGDTVTATGCQNWVGDSATVMSRIVELVGAASPPHTNLEPSFVASPSATEAASRTSIAVPAVNSRGSASFSRDLQSWREIHEAEAPSAGAAASQEEQQPAADGEEEEAARQHTPSVSQDPQSWRAIHDAVSTPPTAAAAEEAEEKEESTAEESAAVTSPSPPPIEEETAIESQAEPPQDQWAELGDEEQNPSEEPQPEEAVHVEQSTPPAPGPQEEEPASEESPQDQWAELGDEEQDPSEEPQPEDVTHSEQSTPPPGLQEEEPASEESPQDRWAELGDEEASAQRETPGETIANQIYVNEQWVRVSDEEMRVWNVVAELPLHYPERNGAMLTPYSEDAAAAVVPALPESMETLPSYLEARGANPVEVNMMCLAADQKIGSESVSLGKLALVLMSCDDVASQQLIAGGADYYGEVCDGSLLQKNAPLGFTALCLCASQAYPDEYFFYVPNEDDVACLEALNEGDDATLAALAPLSTQVPVDAYAVRVVGLPKVIELATTDQRDETMVLNQWFSRLVVAEKSDAGITLSFIENIANDEFEAFASAYTARLIQEENALDKKTGATGSAPEMANEEL